MGGYSRRATGLACEASQSANILKVLQAHGSNREALTDGQTEDECGEDSDASQATQTKSRRVVFGDTDKQRKHNTGNTGIILVCSMQLGTVRLLGYPQVCTSFVGLG